MMDVGEAAGLRIRATLTRRAREDAALDDDGDGLPR